VYNCQQEKIAACLYFFAARFFAALRVAQRASVALGASVIIRQRPRVRAAALNVALFFKRASQPQRINRCRALL
jgi:hypothetical protein